MKTTAKPLYLIIWCILVITLNYSCKTNVDPYTADQLSQIQRFNYPQFIPNSTDILYINDSTGNLELWKLLETGKAKKITTLNQRINNLQISIDGKFGIFTADSGGNERFDMFKYDISSGLINRIIKTPNVSETGFRISPDGNRIVYEADTEIPFRTQIFILDIENQTTTQITKGDIPVSTPRWSNNGKTIAAVKSGDGQNGELLLIDITSQKVDTVRPLTDNNIIVPIVFSPDDRFLLCKIKNEHGFDQLSLVDTKSHNLKLIGPKKWDVVEAIWNNKEGIYFIQNVSGRTGIYHMSDPDSKTTEVLPPNGFISFLDIDLDATNLLFTKQDGSHPQEIYRLDIKANKLKQLTSSLPPDIDTNRLIKAEHFSIYSFDSTIIEGFYYKPRIKSNKPFPAVLNVHGGPSGIDCDWFDVLSQSLVQQGFFVLNVNYRGSVGYGKVFEDLNNKDWGGGDRKDLRLAAESFIHQGLIDKNKIAITGGSYGGYMTLIALTKDPDFYAAGAEAYGMPDLIYDYNLCKDRFGLWYEVEMGNPTKDSALFADRSPINFLDQLIAPLIIFQGANDANVPKNESDLVFKTLKELGNEPEYVVYQDEGHGFTRRENINDWVQKTIDFFQRKLKDNN
jgi:dipeptidyl aminopeptidase/acylaminoacyl peptidase